MFSAEGIELPKLAHARLYMGLGSGFEIGLDSFKVLQAHKATNPLNMYDLFKGGLMAVEDKIDLDFMPFIVDSKPLQGVVINDVMEHVINLLTVGVALNLPDAGFAPDLRMGSFPDIGVVAGALVAMVLGNTIGRMRCTPEQTKLITAKAKEVFSKVIDSSLNDVINYYANDGKVEEMAVSVGPHMNLYKQSVELGPDDLED